MTEPVNTTGAPEKAPEEAHLVEQLQAAEKKISELEQQVKEKENKYLYLYAEFENFKKRSLKDRSEQIKFGCEPLARDILQVVDNLERAMNHIPTSTDKTLVDGLNMVLNQFRSILEKQGIHRVETHQQNFDPNLHEAIAQQPSDHPAGTIVEEQARGYTFHGRLLRPARVIVSGGQPQEKKATGS